MPTDLPDRLKNDLPDRLKKQQNQQTVTILLAPVGTLLSTILIVSFTVFCWNMAFALLGWWLPKDVAAMWTAYTISLPMWGMFFAFFQLTANTVLAALKLARK